MAITNTNCLQDTQTAIVSQMRLQDWMGPDYCMLLFNSVNLHVWISLSGLHFTAIALCTLLGIALGNSNRLAFSIHPNGGLGVADPMAIIHGTYGLCGPLLTGLLYLLFLSFFPCSAHSAYNWISFLNMKATISIWVFIRKCRRVLTKEIIKYLSSVFIDF